MDLAEQESRYFFHTYKRLPLEIDRGEGVYLYTRDGTRYLDMFAGLAVNALGYAHPAVVRAVQHQAALYMHLSNYYLQEPQMRLAELLTRMSGYPKVFFCNSGTEATEAAIKLSRKWGSTRGKGTIVSFTKAFHGRTMGALSMMDRANYRQGFGPFPDGFRTVEFNNREALRNAVDATTLAVALEAIQGEGGVLPLSLEAADEIVALKQRYGFLLIADEVQCGIGRTGRFFGYQHYPLAPDIVTVAKPLGGGLPLGAVLAREDVAGTFQPGMHGTTFGGNPVACAAGAAVLREIAENGLMANAERMGALLRSGFLGLQKEYPGLIREVRGRGLMLGIELARECEPVVTAMRDRKVLINGTDQTVLRFLPPLIIGEQHVEETLAALSASFAGLH
jgi:acetylornithine/N-succinyldiaminopimelate aminotransferase